MESKLPRCSERVERGNGDHGARDRSDRQKSWVGTLGPREPVRVLEEGGITGKWEWWGT